MLLDLEYTYSSASLQQPESQFDKRLVDRWNYLMEQGYFRYEVKNLQTRIIEGKYGYVAELQTNRATNRRAPQSMLGLTQAFDASKFNFTKINPERELIFKLRKTDELEGRDWTDQVIINVSPTDVGHSLITPQVDLQLPQVLTEYSIVLALEVIFLSSDPSIRILFNSLCAYASVNNVHWHILYLNTPAYIQSAKLERRGEVHLLEDYPAPAFVFIINSPKDILKTARLVHRLTSWLTSSDVAHNVFIARSKGSEDGESNSFRVFVWAREKVVGAKDPGAFLMAVCELSGQILVYQEDRYKTLTESEVAEEQARTVLPVFNRVKASVIEMFQSQ